MSNASDNIPTAAEVIDAVRNLQDRYYAALEERDALEGERDELRRRLAEREDQDVKVFTMGEPLPHDREFTFFPDIRLLAISPDIDAEREARLLSQLRPELTSCDVCFAPLWAGQTCTMHDAPEAGAR